MPVNITLDYEKKIVNVNAENPRGKLRPLSFLIWSWNMLLGYVFKYGKSIEDKRRKEDNCLIYLEIKVYCKSIINKLK